MKKKTILIVLYFVGLAVLISTWFIQYGRTTYVLPSRTSSALFGLKPTEFLETYIKFYDTCEDFRDKASIDDNGNLVLRLSREQKQAALDFYRFDPDKFDDVPGVDVADDYTGFTITGDRETVKNAIWGNFKFATFCNLGFRQLFSGEDPETISVTCTIIEESTGKVIYKAVWPEETVSFSLEDWEFSE